MILQHQFEIRQMSLYGSDEEGRKRILQSSVSNGIRHLSEMIEHAIPFKKVPYTAERYQLRLLVVELDEYSEIRNKISDVLKQKLDSETYKQVGELFKQLEGNATGNNSAI